MAAPVRIMGIVNVNDDSFFAGSRVSGVEQFIARVEKLFGDGADAVDIGACSSRPGSTYPGVDEEWRRLEPVLEAVQKRFPSTLTKALASEPSNGNSSPLPAAGGYTGPRFSIDTFSADIVQRAYDIIGPFIVNDISAGQSDPELLQLVAQLGLPYVAMHNESPFLLEGKELQPIITQIAAERLEGTTVCSGSGDYAQTDIVARVAGFFRVFEGRAAAAGLSDWILDPGFGFGKDVDENLELLDRLDELQCFGREILIGVSRKRMTYQPLGLTPSDPRTLGETLRLERLAISRGASWIRCHDIEGLATGR